VKQEINKQLKKSTWGWIHSLQTLAKCPWALPKKTCFNEVIICFALESFQWKLMTSLKYASLR